MQTIIGKNYPKLVIPLIKNAKSSIKIVVYDWRWYSDDPANPCQLFNSAIVGAQKRGVQVRACVNSSQILDPLRENGIDARIPISKNLMHAKFMIIDEKILVIGSHNFSQSAFTQNMETSLILEDEEKIKELVVFFNSIWNL
jgi:phosphatidylserine/phosphatidylglycerophosphate/cardiolipin synthase-like enzyme